MNNNLLIVGAGTYAVVTYEIAKSMNSFDKIDFIDDKKTVTSNGIDVIGRIQDLCDFNGQYKNIIVAIGNPQIKGSLIDKIKKETSFRIVSIISPKAYISPSARIMEGCVIEPMAVVHSGCLISSGCIISAGAVVNHESVCCEWVHVDCNATVKGNSIVPAGSKVCCGQVWNNCLNTEKNLDKEGL